MTRPSPVRLTVLLMVTVILTGAPGTRDRQQWSLFDRSNDPGEMKNQFSGNHPQVRKLQPLLLEWEEARSKPGAEISKVSSR